MARSVLISGIMLVAAACTTEIGATSTPRSSACRRNRAEAGLEVGNMGFTIDGSDNHVRTIHRNHRRILNR